MFERFTPEARGAVEHAQADAGFLGHKQVGTEHLLLGLLHNDVSTAKLLTASGVFYLEARGVVAEIVGAYDPPRPGELPFSPRATRVLELALREALPQGYTEIRPEHLLLGLLREGEGVGARILSDLGVDLAELRTRTTRQLAEQAPAELPVVEVQAPRPAGLSTRLTDLVLGVAGFAVGLLTGWLIWGWS